MGQQHRPHGRVQLARPGHHRRQVPLVERARVDDHRPACRARRPPRCWCRPGSSGPGLGASTQVATPWLPPVHAPAAPSAGPLTGRPRRRGARRGLVRERGAQQHLAVDLDQLGLHRGEVALEVEQGRRRRRGRHLLQRHQRRRHQRQAAAVVVVHRRGRGPPGRAARLAAGQVPRPGPVGAAGRGRTRCRSAGARTPGWSTAPTRGAGRCAARARARRAGRTGPPRARAGAAARPPSRRRRRSGTPAPPGGVASRTPHSSKVSRTAAQTSSTAVPGSTPSRRAHSCGPGPAHGRARSSPSRASTPPPGKTAMPAANAIVGWRRIRNTSGPASPSRTSTTVDAARGGHDLAGRARPTAGPARPARTAARSPGRSSSRQRTVARTGGRERTGTPRRSTIAPYSVPSGRAGGPGTRDRRVRDRGVPMHEERRVGERRRPSEVASPPADDHRRAGHRLRADGAQRARLPAARPAAAGGAGRPAGHLQPGAPGPDPAGAGAGTTTA